MGVSINELDRLASIVRTKGKGKGRDKAMSILQAELMPEVYKVRGSLLRKYPRDIVMEVMDDANSEIYSLVCRYDPNIWDSEGMGTPSDLRKFVCFNLYQNLRWSIQKRVSQEELRPTDNTCRDWINRGKYKELVVKFPKCKRVSIHDPVIANFVKSKDIVDTMLRREEMNFVVNAVSECSSPINKTIFYLYFIKEKFIRSIAEQLGYIQVTVARRVNMYKRILEAYRMADILLFDILKTREEEVRGFRGMEDPRKSGIALIFSIRAPKDANTNFVPRACFTMLGVPFPLDWVSLDEECTILGTGEMLPDVDEALNIEDKNVTHVVELPYGYVDAHQLKVGNFFEAAQKVLLQ